MFSKALRYILSVFEEENGEPERTSLGTQPGIAYNTGKQENANLVLPLLHFLSKSEPKAGQKMGKILQTPHGEFHLNTLLGCFQLCS